MCNVQELLLYFKFTAAKVENKKQQQKKTEKPRKDLIGSLIINLLIDNVLNYIIRGETAYPTKSCSS